MRKASFACFLTILLACLSCQSSYLDKIESDILEHPDSSLWALEQITPSSLKWNGEKARYALLYSMALDKNYIDVSSDSTIIKAVRWYEKTRDKHRLMLAYYYAGRVEYNSSNYTGSITYANDALELAEQTGDEYQKGLICWLIGDTYFANHNYLKARHYYLSAKESFDGSGKERYALFSMCEAAKMAIALGEYSKCDSLLGAIRIRLDINDDALLSTYYSIKIRSCSLQEENVEAISSFYEWEHLLVKSDPLTVYGQMALSFAQTGDKVMAEYCLRKAALSASKDQMPQVSSYTAGVLYEAGLYKQAIDSLQKGYDYQNKVAYIQFANSIDDALSEYYKVQSRMKEQKMKERLTLVSVVAALFILGTFAYHNFKRKEYSRKLNSAKADIIFISQMNKDSLKNFAKFIQIRQGMLDDVIAGYSEEKSSGKSGMVYDIIDDKIESLKAGGEGFKKLVKDLNACFDNIVKKLRAHFPNISRQDYRILVYYFSGFSQETVSTLTGIQVEKLYNLKRSWVKRFYSLPSPDRDLLLGRMNTGKYR
ncbi:MAG: hypothetical protein IKR38_02015 [Bacteroidales bacterium]|nr:hypothetical protein [Bacteroidales bacterium]